MAADNIAALHMGLCLVEKKKDEKSSYRANLSGAAVRKNRAER